MANAASQQAVEVGKDRLREFLDAPPSAKLSSSSLSSSSAPRRKAMPPMSVDGGEEIEMDSLGDGS